MILSKYNKLLRPLLLLSVAFYFSYHVMSGDNGLLAYMQVSDKLEQKQIALSDLKSERTQLENKVNRMYETSVDADLLDEQVRRMLGHVKPNEVVIFENEIN